MPLAAAKVLAVPLLLRATARPPTGLVNASRMATVTAVVAVLLATTPLGDRPTWEVAVAGAPATNATLTCGAAAPAVNVTVLLSAFVDFSEVVSWPLALVGPVTVENVSLPLALELVKVPFWLGSTLPYWSRTVAVSTMVLALSAV